MSLLARVDRLTASSLLCFIFGCLLCLSAVILRDGFERTCFHLFKIRRKWASFHVLSALYHKCKKKKNKKIQERVDKIFVYLFLSCKEPNRQESNLQSCNMRRCRNQSEEAGPSCSGSSWATVIRCTPKKCIHTCFTQFSKAFSPDLLTLTSGTLLSGLTTRWRCEMSIFFFNISHTAPNCDGRSRSTPDKTPGIQWAHNTTRTAPCGSGRGSWALPQAPPGRLSSTSRRRGSRGSREPGGRRSRPPTDPRGAQSPDRTGMLAAAVNKSLGRQKKKKSDLTTTKPVTFRQPPRLTTLLTLN